MKNIVYKIVALVVINVLTLATAAFIILQPKDAASTLAASSAYSANWKITSCRTVSSPTQGLGSINIGPAEWTVTYALPSSTIVEVWKAAGWKNNATVLSSVGAVFATTAGEANCNALPVNLGSYANGLSVSGSYGFVYSYDSKYGRAMGGSSMPTGWIVTSTIQ